MVFAWRSRWLVFRKQFALQFLPFAKSQCRGRMSSRYYTQQTLSPTQILHILNEQQTQAGLPTSAFSHPTTTSNFQLNTFARAKDRIWTGWQFEPPTRCFSCILARKSVQCIKGRHFPIYSPDTADTSSGQLQPEMHGELKSGGQHHHHDCWWANKINLDLILDPFIIPIILTPRLDATLLRSYSELPNTALLLLPQGREIIITFILIEKEAHLPRHGLWLPGWLH